MSRPVADVLIEHAITAVTYSGPTPRAGRALGETTLVGTPAVASMAGRIVYVGPAASLGDHVDVAPGALRIDATGCSLLPGFVDAAPSSRGATESDADPAAEWALAHGTTTFLDRPDRRRGSALLAPVDALADSRDELRPAQPLVEAGDPVALTALSTRADAQVSSMPYALMVASLGMGLSLEEALTAATLNAAWSLDCDEECGSLEPGKRMDVVVVKEQPAELLAAGAAALRMVIRSGKLVAWV